MKEQFRGTNTAKQICEIEFGIASAGEMRKMSHLNVVGVNLYDTNTRTPSKYGVLDTRMGTSSKEMECGTCGRKIKECVGHCGFIDLALPCFHIGFFNNILNILQCICKNCSRILLKPEDRLVEFRRSKRPNLTYLEKKAVKKQIILKCKKVTKCPHCLQYNGNVKKAALLKIVHMKYPPKKKMVESQIVDLQSDLSDAMTVNKEISAYFTKGQEMLHPDRVLELFSNMLEEDLPFLIMDKGAPKDLVITRILAPPLIIRPSVVSEIKTGTTEDDITMRLLEIVRCNQNLVSATESGNNIQRCMEMWDFLQLQVAQLYNSQLTGIPKAAQDTSKQLRGLVQRLKGKQGRFRGNLSGKRVDFSGRTVISPDPNLRIDQVGVPIHMAKILTFPEVVTNRNRLRLVDLVLNGVDMHPGANRVVKKNGIVFRPQSRYKKEIARDLQIGDTVERHMEDRDIILFNRQPSLHRLSIQAFYTKVLPHKTLRFNECCCNPFNADFDGDEMNIHLPQTHEARAEAIILMGSKSNIRSPRNGEPLIAAIQDFITGSFLLTQKDVFFDRHRAQDISSCILGPFEEMVDLPAPAILKPMMLWTGKQIFSLILKPSNQCKVLINMRTKCGGKRVEDKRKSYACKTCRHTHTIQMVDSLLLSACTPCRPSIKNFIANGYSCINNDNNNKIGDDDDVGGKSKKKNSKKTKKINKSSNISANINSNNNIPTNNSNNNIPTSNNNRNNHPTNNNSSNDLSKLLCDACATEYSKLFETCKRELCSKCLYYHKHCRKEEMDPNDNFMVLHNSQLLAGYMDKANLGSGSKTNIFFSVLKCYGEEEAASALSRLTRVSTHFMSFRGFSISIKDVTPGRQLIEKKMGLLTDGYSECDVYIKQLVQGHLQLMPGCSEEETLESVLLKVLSNIREQAADACLMELPKNNSPLVMAVSGSKGSNINISQMIACVGQQSVSGKRVPHGFEARALPHFARNSKDPSARGFVGNSFFSSLTASEFFFHTAAGREGLVDTAVKTSETGYMQRRLMKALEDLACGYDSTVRNSENQVVQFVYGSDGLDPIAMEAKYQKSRNKMATGSEANRPIDFQQVFGQIVREHPCRQETSLTAEQVHRVFNTLLQDDAFSFMRSYKLNAGHYMRGRLCGGIGGGGKGGNGGVGGEGGGGGDGEGGERGGGGDGGSGGAGKDNIGGSGDGKCGSGNEGKHNDGAVVNGDEGCTRTEDGSAEAGPIEATTGHPSPEKANNFGRHLQKFINSLSANLDKSFVMWNDVCKYNRVTRTQLQKFLNKCYSKFMDATLPYSTAVGALAAQSIGEPGTQMTLKTFHFAGVASMNITQGVPRILEIINATRNISTPIIVCPLDIDLDKNYARLIKGRVERTFLGEICQNIREVYHNDESLIVLELETERFHLLNLELDIHVVRKAILAAHPKVKIQPHDIECHGKSVIVIRNSSTTSKTNPYFTFKQLKLALNSVVVKGIPSVKRAVMQILDNKNQQKKKKSKQPAYELVVEGTDLRAVMTTRGVVSSKVSSNNIVEVKQTLGIEAARATIISEMRKTMGSHGISLDVRHVMLLADRMCHTGEVLGINRGGLAKMRESALGLASFEKTSDHLFEAAYHGQKDAITGVSESIIMGIPMKIGTGAFQILHDRVEGLYKTRPLVFDTPQFRLPEFS